MVAFVVIHNFLLGLACLYVARQIWQLRRKLASVSNTLVYVEGVMRGFLGYAPTAVLKAQSGTNRLHDRYQQLGIQSEKIQQIVSFLSLGQFFWRYRARGKR